MSETSERRRTMGPVSVIAGKRSWGLVLRPLGLMARLELGSPTAPGLRFRLSWGEGGVVWIAGGPSGEARLRVGGEAVRWLLRGRPARALEFGVHRGPALEEGPLLYWDLGAPAEAPCPRWRRGMSFPRTALLGPPRLQRRLLAAADLEVQAAGVTRRGRARIYEESVVLPRWPLVWRRATRVRLDFPQGLPPAGRVVSWREAGSLGEAMAGLAHDLRTCGMVSLRLGPVARPGDGAEWPAREDA